MAKKQDAPKKPVSTSVEEDIFLRIQRLAEFDDGRSQAQVIAAAIKRGLPYLEEEQEAKNQALERLRTGTTAHKRKPNAA